MKSFRSVLLFAILFPVCAASQQAWDEMDVIDGPNPTLRYGFYTEPSGHLNMGRYYFIDDGSTLRVRLVPFGKAAVELPVLDYDRDYEQTAVTEISAGHAIVNAVIANPTIGERLREDGLSVGRMTRQLIQPGVTEFVLYVHTCAMCNPGVAKSGFVTITEDVRPTYVDAPVKYSVSFSIEEKI